MTQYLSPTGKCINCEHAEWVRGSYFCNRRKIRESVLYKVGTCQRFSAKRVERKEPQTVGEEAFVIANLEKENAKLRELCAEMFEAVKCCCGEWCTKTASNCDNNECGWHKCYVALRELGIEVDK